jgi:hypothetical protein
MSYTETFLQTTERMVLDLPNTEPQESVQVTRIIDEYPGQPLVTRYQINNGSPYISVDCLSSELEEVRDIIQYIIDNPPQNSLPIIQREVFPPE